MTQWSWLQWSWMRGCYQRSEPHPWWSTEGRALWVGQGVEPGILAQDPTLDLHPPVRSRVSSRQCWADLGPPLP